VVHTSVHSILPSWSNREVWKQISPSNTPLRAMVSRTPTDPAVIAWPFMSSVAPRPRWTPTTDGQATSACRTPTAPGGTVCPQLEMSTASAGVRIVTLATSAK